MITYSKKHPERETTNNPNEKVGFLRDLLIIKAVFVMLAIYKYIYMMWEGARVVDDDSQDGHVADDAHEKVEDVTIYAVLGEVWHPGLTRPAPNVVRRHPSWETKFTTDILNFTINKHCGFDLNIAEWTPSAKRPSCSSGSSILRGIIRYIMSFIRQAGKACDIHERHIHPGPARC